MFPEHLKARLANAIREKNLPESYIDLEIMVSALSHYGMSAGDWETITHYCNGLDTVVELGTCMGDTTILLSNLAENVITVDIFENVSLIADSVQRENYRNHLRANNNTLYTIRNRLAPYKNVRVVQELTTEYARQNTHESIDAVFIDADHSYSGVKNDFEAWFPIVKRGGLFLFHDVGPGCEVFDFYNKELVFDSRIKEEAYTPNCMSWVKVFKKL